MSSATGVSPPLHRRFDEKAAMRYIRNRYHHCREKIAKQVKVLQEDTSFRRKCQSFYEKGYKDWVILTAIMNCVLNWKAKEIGLTVSPEEDPKQFLELQHTLRDTVYPSRRFLGEDMIFQIQVMHGITALKTYGFELRRRDFKPEVVEKFLRERMKHFDFDLPHNPLFGEPPGDWPRI